MSAKNLNVTPNLINDIKELSIQASHEINLIYQHYKLGGKNIVLNNKKDQSPLTKADLTSHDIIHKALRKITPTIPIVSEELLKSHSFIDQELFWLIDPLDGTKEFIYGTDEFTINIALIKNGSVDFGLINAPALNQIYWGSKLLGSYMSIGSNSRKITVSNPSKKDPLKFISSRNHLDEETAQFINTFPNKISTSIGSSLKFCLIAKGEAHIYPRFGRTCLWDTAAGQAILENAGGYVSLMSDEPLSYSHSSIYNPVFIASALHPQKIKQYQK